jgi:hypothetical protein
LTWTIEETKEAKATTSYAQPSISIISSSAHSCGPANRLNAQAAQSFLSTQPITATPLNVVNLQKQLKFDDSPSVLFAAASASVNPIYDSNWKYVENKNIENTCGSDLKLILRSKIEAEDQCDRQEPHDNECKSTGKCVGLNFEIFTFK